MEVSSSPSIIKCSICNSTNNNNNHHQTRYTIITDPNSGEIICSNCGMVISDKIQETRQEWRTFNTQEQNDRSRTGMPTSLARHDMGLSTIIGRTDKDASGYKIDAAMRSTMERLRTWDFRTQAHTPTDRSLRQAFSELDRLKDKLGLPDAIVEKTAYIYRKAQERGLVRGRTIHSMLAAAVYAACRELGIPKTLKEIATASSIRRRMLAKNYRVLKLELDISTPMVDPMKCIVKVANKVNLNEMTKLSEKTKRYAMSIMNDITKNDISGGKDPMGMAATVLYISCIKTGENITQTDIANAAGVTEVTIRNRFKDLRNKFQLN